MNLAQVHPGDLVEINKKGRVFLALVEKKEPQAIQIKPVTKGVSFMHATAREVQTHYKKVTRSQVSV